MPNSCDDCPVLSRVEALEETNKQHSRTHEGIFDRLRELETKTAVQDTKLDAILSKLDALTAKVEALEAKPGKRWESIAEKAIWAVCAAVIAFLLARVGL